MTRFVFPVGNDFEFRQDFSGWRGIPDDVVFELAGTAGSLFCLRARGHGKAPQYGNGAIYVTKDVLEKAIEVGAPRAGDGGEARG